MIESLSLYFQNFIHPTGDRSQDNNKLSHFELLGISWALHFVYAFYSVFAVYLGVKSYEYLSQSQDFSHLLFEAMNITFQKFNLFFSLAQAIVYPFLFQFAVKFWVFILKFYSEVFEAEDEQHSPSNIEAKIQELIATLFSANLFLIIPIFGNVLSILTQAYFLFIGTRKKLGFTRTQAFLVLMTPLFIAFLVTILIASYMTLLLSLL